MASHFNKSVIGQCRHRQTVTYTIFQNYLEWTCGVSKCNHQNKIPNVMTNSQIERISLTDALKILSDAKIKIKLTTPNEDIMAKAREILRDRKKLKC